MQKLKKKKKRSVGSPTFDKNWNLQRGQSASSGCFSQNQVEVSINYNFKSTTKGPINIESAPVAIGNFHSQIKAVYRGFFKSMKAEDQGIAYADRNKRGGGSTRHVRKSEAQYIAEFESSDLDSYAKSRVALLPKGFVGRIF